MYDGCVEGSVDGVRLAVRGQQFQSFQVLLHRCLIAEGGGGGALLYTLITPHWKVLQSRNWHHSTPLDVPFPMVSLFAKIFRFWPKTMVKYSKVFDQISLRTNNFSMEWVTKLKFAPFCSS